MEINIGIANGRVRKGSTLSAPVNGFSKSSVKDIFPDATARNSPSWLSAGFTGRPCPAIADVVQKIKKIQFPVAKTAWNLCAHGHSQFQH
ncbi:MAG: hypothetical protein NC242_06505 [Roseburia sp.]|nr:hypothetical protein [Roseburia sp.]